MKITVNGEQKTKSNGNGYSERKDGFFGKGSIHSDEVFSKKMKYTDLPRRSEGHRCQ